MIRFVYIGSQITDLANEEAREFAIYDTVIDRFLSFLGSYTFDSIEELESYMIVNYDTEFRNRILGIVPDWYRNGFSGPNVGKEIRS